MLTNQEEPTSGFVHHTGRIRQPWVWDFVDIMIRLFRKSKKKEPAAIRGGPRIDCHSLALGSRYVRRSLSQSINGYTLPTAHAGVICPNRFHVCLIRIVLPLRPSTTTGHHFPIAPHNIPRTVPTCNRGLRPHLSARPQVVFCPGAPRALTAPQRVSRRPHFHLSSGVFDSPCRYRRRPKVPATSSRKTWLFGSSSSHAGRRPVDATGSTRSMLRCSSIWICIHRSRGRRSRNSSTLSLTRAGGRLRCGPR